LWIRINVPPEFPPEKPKAFQQLKVLELREFFSMQDSEQRLPVSDARHDFVVL
jgi:hypothetical protein